MSKMTRVWFGVAVICLAGLAGGCGEGFNVQVLLDKNDPGLKDEKGALKSIEVNIVAVNDAEWPRWEQMSMSDYWEVGNAMRTSAVKHVMTFSEGSPDFQVLKKADPIWQTWLKQRQAKHLLVLAFLPGIKDQVGAADPRRAILPLKVDRWEKYYWGEDTIRIQLGSGGLTPLRQPNR